MWSVRLPDLVGGWLVTLHFTVNTSYHSCRMRGVGGRARARESLCRSLSPCRGRLRSPEVARHSDGAWQGGEPRPARTRWAEVWSPASAPGRAGRSACCPRGRQGWPRRVSPPRGCEADPGDRCVGHEAVEACTSSPETQYTLHIVHCTLHSTQYTQRH